ncbi:hypothetical protein PY365_30990 [Roseiarcaceae bacterium H3SJ34-1]|uniref:hypothetical protein n=1 Tax=Terripilifer ovatus TaxID=3032367 RepID=UPI003AB96490|nr:hypothetical protein [Roseiarcaceae bacterium H3SJ34-1]
MEKSFKDTSARIPAVRMILPVALGMAFGIGVGAAALAHGLFPMPPAAPQVLVAQASVSQPAQIKPLSSAPGIRFVRANREASPCWTAIEGGRKQADYCRD